MRHVLGPGQELVAQTHGVYGVVYRVHAEMRNFLRQIDMTIFGRALFFHFATPPP